MQSGRLSGNIVRRTSVRRGDASPERVRQRFVGRHVQLELLRERYDVAAASGAGAIVFVTGDAGIGKSRLAREFVAFARARGGRAGTGFALDYAPAALAPVLDALADAGLPFAMPRAEFDALDKREKFDALFAFVAYRSAQAPVALVLEDLHVADEATRDFLRYASAKIARVPIVVLATSREDEGAAGDAFHTIPALWRTRLEPLNDRELSALLRNGLQGERPLERDRLHAIRMVAEGNPFVAEALLAETLANAPPGGGPIHIPASLAAAFARQLARVEPADRLVLAHAAIVGRTFGSEMLVEIGAGDIALVRTGLRRARAARLIEELPGSLYAFRHPLVQTIAVRELLAEEVRALHAAVARAIERGADAASRSLELAHHWAASGDAERAARLGEFAGDAAMAAGTYGAAADAYRYAAASHSASDFSAHIELKLARALLADRRFDAASERAQAVHVASLAANDRTRARAAASIRAACAAHTGDGIRALADLDEMATTPEDDPEIRFERAATSALAFASLDRADDAAAFATEARAVASEYGFAVRAAAFEIDYDVLRGEAALTTRGPRAALAAFDRALAAHDASEAFDPAFERFAFALAEALERAGEISTAARVFARIGYAAERAAGAAAVRNRQGRTRGELTKREREIGARVAAGMSNRSIAAELVVSERTVEDHVGSALRKLGLKNRAELAAHVARGG